MFYRNPNEIFIEELLAAYDLLNEQKSPNLAISHIVLSYPLPK
ncbi:18847_t:CDS:2 [Entrophospora sp. SA101]|nr:18847_t:CDS:2 [Entrophospora sp. SA101]